MGSTTSELGESRLLPKWRRLLLQPNVTKSIELVNH